MSLIDVVDLIKFHDGVMMFNEVFENMGVSDSISFQTEGYRIAYSGIPKILKLIDRNSKLQLGHDKLCTTLLDMRISVEDLAKHLFETE